ncbi:MAG TPA: ribonuclease R, partial [Thermopetrobacter sp.]|nr:ribonuclease R [Thermopetrobacter sp.]
IHEQGIRDAFPEEVLREAAALAPFSPEGREDIRDIPLVTIDPPDARDHDDAVWAAPDDDPDNEGGHRVIVAIADVSWYVRPGTAMDAEARLRGNSTYFPDRVVPMLPERLSTDLCSLKAGEDRPALACFMTFDRDGNKRKHRFARVVMRSAAFLTYEQAQKAIDGHPDEKTAPLLETVLKPLWSCHDTLMAARRRRGPLELDVPERKLILDATGLIERVVSPVRLEAHRLIEELMIQANVAAAEMLEERGSPLIYRVHDAPAPEKIHALAEFLQTLGISAPLGQKVRPMHFNRILERVKGTEYEHVVNLMVLRTQSQAVYDTHNIGHFGLNLPRYAHFTSPIRRYADTVVHRALVSALKLGAGGLSKYDIEHMQETAELISGCERRSMAAERDTVDRMMARFMAERVGATFHARITGATRAGLFVALEENGADGFIPISTLRGDYFVHDEARHALVGRNTGETFQLGDLVEVRLLEVAPVAGGLRFEMISHGKKGRPPRARGR